VLHIEKTREYMAKIRNFQQVRPDMQNWKRNIFIALSVIITLLVLRKTYVMLFLSQSSVPTPLSVKRVLERAQEEAIVARHDSLRDYNFKRMLKLVEETKSINRRFYHQFKQEPDFGNGIDRKQIQILLAELYREKLRLERYIWKIRVYYKDLVPRKKYRSLIYHQKVIDGCIKDLEAILRSS